MGCFWSRAPRAFQSTGTRPLNLAGVGWTAASTPPILFLYPCAHPSTHTPTLPPVAGATPLFVQGLFPIATMRWNERCWSQFGYYFWNGAKPGVDGHLFQVGKLVLVRCSAWRRPSLFLLLLLLLPLFGCGRVLTAFPSSHKPCTSPGCGRCTPSWTRRTWRC